MDTLRIKIVTPKFMPVQSFIVGELLKGRGNFPKKSIGFVEIWTGSLEQLSLIDSARLQYPANFLFIIRGWPRGAFFLW